MTKISIFLACYIEYVLANELLRNGKKKILKEKNNIKKEKIHRKTKNKPFPIKYCWIICVCKYVYLFYAHFKIKAICFCVHQKYIYLGRLHLYLMKLISILWQFYWVFLVYIYNVTCEQARLLKKKSVILISL